MHLDVIGQLNLHIHEHLEFNPLLNYNPLFSHRQFELAGFIQISILKIQMMAWYEFSQSLLIVYGIIDMIFHITVLYHDFFGG